MESSDIIRALWDRIDARDWPGVAALLADDVQVCWPASGELITGADNFVAVQAEYPEGWSIHVLAVVADGERVVSEVEVPLEGVGVFRVASFWTVTDGRVAAGTEYWIGVGTDPAPAWRAPYVRLVPEGEQADAHARGDRS